MKVRIIFFAGIMVVFFCNGQPKKRIPADMEPAKKTLPGGYQLVWQDEFNKDGMPDTAYWRFEKGFVRNQELQWYQAGNAYCKNGFLIIEGRSETRPSPVYVNGSNDWKKKRDSIHYTSSSINTAGKIAWKYGRFIMRGRIDISPGMWPAWWTVGVDGNWPATGEIDIMEYYNNKLLANIACAGPDHRAVWFSNTKPADSLGGVAWASQFHVWRMDWDEKSIALYADDQLMNRTVLSKLQNQDGTAINPFMQPHYMLLNLAIGGTNGGDPSHTRFPKKFEVDYVRVYQKQGNK